MNILELLLGQIPEALYFALFMIYTKRLNEKRIWFIVLTVLEYILLFIPPLSIWSHILYFIFTYGILKWLYRNKAQITDIFTLGIASVITIVLALICYLVCLPFGISMIIGNIIQKICMFAFLYITKNKLPKIQDMYKKFWNRNDKIPKPIKSTTFRCINLVIFNIMFFMIHTYIIFYIIRRC